MLLLRSFLFFFFSFGILCGQSLDLNRLGSDPLLRYRGFVTAAGMLNHNAGIREPWSYYLQGGVDFTLLGQWQIPLRFSFTGQKLDFPTPLRRNRFSLQPSYKNIRLFLGQSQLSFSPYTLNGHQFNGAGLQLQLREKYELQAMWGQLTQAAEYDSLHPDRPFSYSRKGWGGRLARIKGPFQWGLIYFTAADDPKSLSHPKPNGDDYQPRENHVVGLQSKIRFRREFMLELDLGRSSIRENRIWNTLEGSSPTGRNLFDHYYALKSSLAWTQANGSWKLHYERIDPFYRTFGAYFFQNDLEHLSLNVQKSIWKGKLQIEVQSGFQRDNLDRRKSAMQRRLVNMINIQAKFSAHLQGQVSHSDFTAFTHLRPSITMEPLDQGQFNIDTLQFRQLNRQSQLQLQYRFPERNGASASHSLSLSGNRQSSLTVRDQKPLPEAEQEFFQGMIQYRYLQRSGAEWGGRFMGFQNRSSGSIQTVLGPALFWGAPYLKGDLNTRMTLGSQMDFNSGTRWQWGADARYQLLKKHLFSLQVQVMKVDKWVASTNVQYSYAFDNLPVRFGTGVDHQKDKREKMLRFQFRDVDYHGSPETIFHKMDSVSMRVLPLLLPIDRQDRLYLKFQELGDKRKSSDFKRYALEFLGDLYHYYDFDLMLRSQTLRMLRELRPDLEKVDRELQLRFIQWFSDASSHMAFQGLGFTVPQTYFEKEYPIGLIQERLLVNQWFRSAIEGYLNGQDPPVFKAFLAQFWKAQWELALAQFDKQYTPEKIRKSLETNFIEHFYQYALEQLSHHDPDPFVNVHTSTLQK